SLGLVGWEMYIRGRFKGVCAFGVYIVVGGIPHLLLSRLCLESAVWECGFKEDPTCPPLFSHDFPKTKFVPDDGIAFYMLIWS
ncbi:hypothetical protein, partial [Neisseria meningitidis]|uniref:hypothetical protein n=1 Tax=Neisseria meningitidis TaxID=487 RepID=UPI001C990FDF